MADKGVGRKGRGSESKRHLDEISRLRGRIEELEAAEIERTRADDALRESEEQYRSLFERVPVGLYRTTPEGRVLDANPAALEMLGFPDLESMLAANAAAMHVNSGERARWQDLLAQEGLNRDFEAQLRRRDGTVIWTKDNARVVRDADGRVLYYEGAMEDITKRVQAEEEVERLARFPGESPNPMLRVARDGAVLYANEASSPLLNIWGCREGQPFPDDWREFTLDVLSTGSRRDAQVEVEDRVISLTFAPVVDADYVNVYGLDITEQKLMDEERENRMRQLAVLNEVSQAVTSSLDLDRVLTEIVSLTDRVVPNDYASIVLVDEQGRVSWGAESRSGGSTGAHRIRDAGITDWIIRSHQAAVVDEIKLDGSLSPYLGEAAPRLANSEVVAMGVKSFAGLPLITKDRLLGILYLHSQQTGTFSDRMPVLTLFADQAAIAIENAWLYRDSQQRTDELMALNEAGRAMVSSLDVELVLLTAIEQAIRVLHVESGSILLLDAGSGELEFVAASGAGADTLKGQRLPPGAGVAGWVIQNKQSAIVPDVKKDPHFFPKVDDFTSFATRSILAVPLLIQGQVIGVMEALNKLNGPIGAADMRLLESLASSAAIAIEHARLFGQVTDFAANLEREVEARTQELRESEGRFRAIFDSSGFATLVRDAQGGLVSCNDAYLRMFGYTRDEIKERDILDLTHPDDVEESKALLDDMLAGRQDRFRVEKRYLRKDGEVVWGDVSVSAMRAPDGSLEAILAVRADITERKRAEAELKVARQEALEANEAKSQFLANMSHEVRTPMNAIVGMAYLALNTNLSPKQRDYLTRSRLIVNALLGIINDILDFSKIEAGKLAVEAVEFQLEEVLDDLADLVALKVRKKGLELIFHTAADIPLDWLAIHCGWGRCLRT